MLAMTPVVRIAVPVPLPQAFDYAVPATCLPPAVGARVRVPFGNRTLVGICIEADPKDAFADPKELLEVLDEQSILPGDVQRLALWLADYYHYPLGEVFATLLPNAALKGMPLRVRPEEIWHRSSAAAPDLSRAERQRALLAFLDSNGGWASGKAIRAAGFTSAMIAALVRKGAIEAGERRFDSEQPPQLTADQEAAIKDYRGKLTGFSPNLLEGVTGSGKTEVYLRAIADVRRCGRQVLVLVPEIALTPQTLARFRRRYGTTDVMHSGLSDQERLNAWLRCRDGQARILIGTRSAVFTPFKQLGLIVVDEEHDASFKQQDRLRYSARDVAVKRARDLGIPLILGSATPSLESLENVRRGRYRHQLLHQRATGAPMPSMHVLDIRGHPLREGLSHPLTARIERHLDAGGQVLVFLNRRGYAPVYLCPDCGWQAACSRCDARLTLHQGRKRLACHHCGAERPVTETCPSCGSAHLLAVGAGTERTEAGLRERFPDASLIRIDSDTARSQRRLEEGLAKIGRGEPGILIGTQMLAKGHDFPNITMVAAVNADAGFLSADFKAPERTAQLLIQVAGRAGRASRPGEVWIQTLQPTNPALRRLIQEGYAGFADHELSIRHRAGLPPARHMALLRAAAADPAAPAAFLAELRAKLPNDLEVLGPAPAQMQRLANQHRFQLMLLADRRGPLHRGIRAVAGVATPRGVRWEIDVDPADAL
ncbi:MAG: primosomal protein N' [Gammaproteobacteria bacterium]|nr:primosomal protein N' [Gammaproteobacteria bacterium]MYK82242.1 primosomal protein N' [Gammaproteobacteria bacterium]